MAGLGDVLKFWKFFNFPTPEELSEMAEEEQRKLAESVENPESQPPLTLDEIDAIIEIAFDTIRSFIGVENGENEG